MALSKLSGDEQGIIFSQLCNVLDPRVAVAFSSASNELRELMVAVWVSKYYLRIFVYSQRF